MKPLISLGLLASTAMAQGILDSASFGHKQGQAHVIRAVLRLRMLTTL